MPAVIEARKAAIEQHQRRPEMPADVNAEFPGAFAIPGTNAAIKMAARCG